MVKNALHKIHSGEFLFQVLRRDSHEFMAIFHTIRAEFLMKYLWKNSVVCHKVRTFQRSSIINKPSWSFWYLRLIAKQPLVVLMKLSICARKIWTSFQNREDIILSRGSASGEGDANDLLPITNQHETPTIEPKGTCILACHIFLMVFVPLVSSSDSDWTTGKIIVWFWFLGMD